MQSSHPYGKHLLIIYNSYTGDSCTVQLGNATTTTTFCRRCGDGVMPLCVMCARASECQVAHSSINTACFFCFCFPILYRGLYLTTVYSGTFLGEVGSVYSFISNYCV